MSKAAKIDFLEMLHQKVAETLMGSLGDEPSPQMLAQAIKFLKDNGVEPARDADNKALQALAEKIGSIAAGGDPDEIGDILN